MRSEAVIRLVQKDMKKLICLGIASAIACAASAQLTGFRVHAGYGWSGRISTSSGSRHLQGPEFSVDFPLMHLPLIDISLTGDVLLGGQLAHGGDLDGNVYRLFATGRVQVPTSPVSAFFGVGWGTAQARAGEFGSFNGYVTQLGVAFPLGLKTPVVSPELQLAGYLSSRSGLSGFSAMFGIRF